MIQKMDPVNDPEDGSMDPSRIQSRRAKKQITVFYLSAAPLPPIPFICSTVQGRLVQRGKAIFEEGLARRSCKEVLQGVLQGVLQEGIARRSCKEVLLGRRSCLEVLINLLDVFLMFSIVFLNVFLDVEINFKKNPF